ncbi:hypothetical protein [Kitasatospora sp. MBT63]|uniref:hypothetical protein n=1 Tax=Kitasatospora sp. MBT63 TaxID=1444768 RepID=UPI00068CBC02|nr:hypothetical protein [Kitasatospora sp. MBT63]
MTVPLATLATALAPLALLPAAPLPPAAAGLPAFPRPVAALPTVVDADFDPASAFVPPVAISYARDLVPYGAHARVTVERGAGRTVVTVELAGVAPGHRFPAHVHTGRCGADPAASGPHYQDRTDPVQPSTDPAYANDRNEARATVRTDAAGSGRAVTAVPWAFRADAAHSLVLHAGDPAGTHPAAERVACVNVDF